MQLNVSHPGVVGEDLTFLEADPVSRKSMAVRLRQKRQQQHQEILAKAYGEDWSACFLLDCFWEFCKLCFLFLRDNYWLFRCTQAKDDLNMQVGGLLERFALIDTSTLRWSFNHLRISIRTHLSCHPPIVWPFDPGMPPLSFPGFLGFHSMFVGLICLIVWHVLTVECLLV